MFQRKSIKDMFNICSIADDILIVGHETDGKDQEKNPRQLMEIYHQKNFK